MSITTETAVDGEDPGSTPAADGASEPPEPPAGAPAVPGGAAGVAACVEVRSAPPGAPDPAWLRRKLLDAAAHLDRAVARVSVLVVDDAGMAALHERHRGDARVTDVLAFPASAPGAPIEVDLAVNLDEAGRQASARGHGTDRELLLYALHGLLHCAGFDDRARAGFEAMHAEEDRLLRAIGVGGTFARRPESPREEGTS